MKFKHNDQVIVNSEFYRNPMGFVVGYNKDLSYDVSFEIVDPFDGGYYRITRSFHEDELEDAVKVTK